MMKKKWLSVLMFLLLICLGSLQVYGNSVQIKPTPTKTVDVNGTDFVYQEKGSGTALIMIHGGLLNMNMWDDQFPVFSQHYRVIRYDARNHGQSGSGEGIYTHHQDLLILMDQLGIKKAVIMGLSMGGYVALDFALENPERVIALVLVSSGLGGYEMKSIPFLKNQEKQQQAIEKGQLVLMVEIFQQAWTDGPHRTPANVNSAMRNKLKRIAIRNVRKWDKSCQINRLDPPAIGRLKEIHAPTLVVVGSLDMPGILEIADILEKNIKDARKVIVKDTAHMVNMEKPEIFNRIVLDFLSEKVQALPYKIEQSGIKKK